MMKTNEKKFYDAKNNRVVDEDEVKLQFNESSYKDFGQFIFDNFIEIGDEGEEFWLKF